MTRGSSERSWTKKKQEVTMEVHYLHSPSHASKMLEKYVRREIDEQRTRSSSYGSGC